MSTPTPTYKGTVIAKKVIQLINDNKEAFGVGVKQVHYGDQQLIPQVPMVCVEPALVVRELNGTGMRTLNTIKVSIIVYHTGTDTQTVQDECDDTTEDIEDFLNKEAMSYLMGGNLLGGIVTSAFTDSAEHGYVLKSDRMMRANRLILTAFTHTPLVEET